MALVEVPARFNYGMFSRLSPTSFWQLSHCHLHPSPIYLFTDYWSLNLRYAFIAFISQICLLNLRCCHHLLMAAILARIPVLHESKASAISRPRPHPRWECWNKEGRTCMLMVYATSGTFGDGLVLFYQTFIPLTFFPTSYISYIQSVSFKLRSCAASSCAICARKDSSWSSRARRSSRQKKTDESRWNMGGHGLAPKNQKLATINVLCMPIRVILYQFAIYHMPFNTHTHTHANMCIYIYNYIHMSPHIWMHTYMCMTVT